MPALYSLGQHDALDAIKRQLKQDEHLLAYLDDIYVTCKPARAKEVFLENLLQK